MTAAVVDADIWRREFAADEVLLGEQARTYVLQDFSWYSPLLSAQLSNVSVDAIVFPRTLGQLEFAISTSVRMGRPITMRGAGTGNYGQSVPIQGGLLVDMRNYTGVVSVSDASAVVHGGTRMAAAEDAIRAGHRELCLLPTSYKKAQTAGFVAGGAGGLGSITYGMLWDGNVLSADVLSIEDSPRRVHVTAEDIDVLIHTYGTVAVMTELELPVSPAHTWYELGAAFDDFDQATAFCWEFGRMTQFRKRLLSMEASPIPQFFPVKHLYRPGDSVALLIVEEHQHVAVMSLVREFNGRPFAWPKTPEVSQFAFAHSPLWAKHNDPSLSWIQLQWSTDELEFDQQVKAVRSTLGEDRIHFGFTFTMRGGKQLGVGSVGLLPHATAESIHTAIDACRAAGVYVKNPHTYVLEDGGQVNNIDRIVEWKRRLDPWNLLNPGKLRSVA